MEVNKNLLEKIKGDDIRAINLELVDASPIKGYWIYRFIFSEDGKVQEEVITGKDMSDALYRFSVLKDRKLTMFNYLEKYKKNNDRN